jgi:hypothetical protein
VSRSDGRNTATAGRPSTPAIVSRRTCKSFVLLSISPIDRPCLEAIPAMIQRSTQDGSPRLPASPSLAPRRGGTGGELPPHRAASSARSTLTLPAAAAISRLGLNTRRCRRARARRRGKQTGREACVRERSRQNALIQRRGLRPRGWSHVPPALPAPCNPSEAGSKPGGQPVRRAPNETLRQKARPINKEASDNL